MYVSTWVNEKNFRVELHSTGAISRHETIYYQSIEFYELQLHVSYTINCKKKGERLQSLHQINFQTVLLYLVSIR